MNSSTNKLTHFSIGWRPAFSVDRKGSVRFLPEEARQVVRLLKSRVRMVEPRPLTRPVCRDPDGDRILAAALTSQCRAIVTGDKDLTDLRQLEGIAIMTPSEFWRFEAEARTENN